MNNWQQTCYLTDLPMDKSNREVLKMKKMKAMMTTYSIDMLLTHDLYIVGILIKYSSSRMSNLF